jgi:hypothetical protein
MNTFMGFLNSLKQGFTSCLHLNWHHCTDSDANDVHGAQGFKAWALDFAAPGGLKVFPLRIFFLAWRSRFSPMRSILWAPSGRPEMKRGKTNEAWLALQTKHQSDADQSLAKWNLLGKRISSVPARREVRTDQDLV